MKKGFTLAELLVVTTILGILAAVLVPKLCGHFERHACENDLDKCKVESPEVYYNLCNAIKDLNDCIGFCKEFITEKNLKHCFGDDIKMVFSSRNAITVVYANDKQHKDETKEIKPIRDTVYVYDTIFVDKSYDFCVKACTENNKSQSVINFCIKEECNYKN